MHAILQRVSRASVEVEGRTVGAIGLGLLVLLGVEEGDGPQDAEAVARKLAELRIFEDPAGKMNLDASQVGGEFLIVSQFTLAASLRRGRRPSFDRAAAPRQARPLVDQVVRQLAARGFRVETGSFGASMKVELVNEGPVTFSLLARDGKIVG